MFNTIQTIAKPDRWSAFARGMFAFGSAEAVTRIVRLASILVVARQVSVEILGAAALGLSLFELVRVLTSVGIGQRIIAATENELAGLCNTANRLFWIVCIAVMVFQLFLATITWLVFAQSEVATMLAALSLVYVFMPAGLVRIFLAMRDQRMAATARVAATQNIADCALTVLLVLVWPSAWAIILPKLLTAPIWLLMARRTSDWAPDRNVVDAPVSAFASFGPAVLGSELLAAARLHGDKLIVAGVLGTEALGLYYFAFNAGLGITQSIVAACNLVLFPHLARTNSDAIDSEFRRAFVLGISVLLPFVAAQVLLAPFYVPLVFGTKWIAATPYIAILACAALPLFAGATLGARYRSLGQPFAETRLMAAATIAALAGLALGAQFNLAFACAGFGLGLAAVLSAPTVLRFIPNQTDHSIPRTGDIS